MGEKETAREASAPSISERSTVQDFEKNTERAESGGGGDSGIVQHNQSHLEFRQAAGDSGSEELQRKDITVTILGQKVGTEQQL